MTAEEAHTRIQQDKSLVILDVRNAGEFREGHIARARLIPLGDLGRCMQSLPRDGEILCVCNAGSRSSMAVRRLIAAGYHAILLRGGLNAWQSAGFPVHWGA